MPLLRYAWVVDLIRRGHVPVKKLLTHRWPLAEARQAFGEVADGRDVKGMLEMG